MKLMMYSQKVKDYEKDLEEAVDYFKKVGPEKGKERTLGAAKKLFDAKHEYRLKTDVAIYNINKLAEQTKKLNEL